MAVISVTEIWSGRNGSDNDKRVREYTRAFRVITDSFEDGAPLVMAATGIPELYSFYDGSWKSTGAGIEQDAGAVAVKIEATNTDDPNVWEVHVLYSSNAEVPLDVAANKKKADDKQPKDPTEQPPKQSCHTVKVQKVIEKDAIGQPVVNSVGDRFDPPLTIDVNHIILVIQKYKKAWDNSLIGALANKTNSTPFFGNGAGTVKFHNAGGELMYINGKFVWLVTFEFEVAPEQWQPVNLIDRGYHYIDPAFVKPVLIRDEKSGHPFSNPWLLDGKGKPLPAGAKPVYLPFFPYDSIDFNQLDLGGTFPAQAK